MDTVLGVILGTKHGGLRPLFEGSAAWTVITVQKRLAALAGQSILSNTQLGPSMALTLDKSL